MDVDLEEHAIKILVLAEKDLSKRNFIDSFRRCLKYKSYDEYYKTECGKQTGVSDTFNARYKKLCFIDTPELDPNASLSANLAVIRSIKLLFHTSGHLNGILCLIHNEPKYYLEWIFTHLFTGELLPEIMKKLLFVFVKGNESAEAVELFFGNLLEKYEVDISQISCINWPVDIVDVVYTNLTDPKQKEAKWNESIIFFQKVYEYFVERKMGKVQLECKFSNKSDLKIVKNFLDILTEIAFTIEDNMVIEAKYKDPNNYCNNSGDTIQILESKNYCISICRSVKCASKNKGICCECKLVSKPDDIKKCTMFMPPSNMCTKCGCSITKHDAVPYKVTSQSYNSSYQYLLSSIVEKRRFVINTICALTVFEEGYDLSKIFKNRLQEKIDTDSRENSPYKNLIFQFEEAMNQIGKIKSDISINDVSIMDILKCIETAVEKSLISADYRNAFLSPDIELVACNRDVGDKDEEKNFNLSLKDKHLEENFNNLNV